MHTYIQFMLIGLLLALSGNAAAHNAVFSHPVIESNFLHMLMHYLLLIALGVGMFLLSRWLIRLNQR